MLTIEMETEQTTGGTTTYSGQQTPNTFGRGLLKRLRIANEAEAAGQQNNNNEYAHYMCNLDLLLCGAACVVFSRM